MGRATFIFNKIVDEGVKAIDEFIENAVSEELFLDFKQSSDRGKNTKLSQDDLNNFGVAISGFGNSQGGVIVWGIRCTKKEDGADVAHSKMPIENPKRFKSWLEGCVSGRTLAPHPGVRNHSIEASGGCGYVISLIPKSDWAPHQEIKTLSYYMRAGSSFVKVPHDILSGMFGKRPQPRIIHRYEIKPVSVVEGRRVCIESGIILRNEGIGIARDVYLNANILSFPGAPSELAVFAKDPNIWDSRILYGMAFSAITKNGTKLAPTSFLPVFSLTLLLEPPFEKDFYIYANCGSDGCQTIHFEMKSSKDEIQECYDNLMHKIEANKLGEDDKLEFSRKVLGLDSKCAVSAAHLLA